MVKKDVNLVFEQNLTSLLPFVPILQGGNDPPRVRQALRGLREDETLQDLEPLLSFFASFVLELPIVRDIMRWDMTVLKESPWYNTILEEGWQEGWQGGHEAGRKEGLQQGRQEGLQEGRQEGLQEGRQEGRQEGLQEGRQEGLQEGRQEGRQEGEATLILRLLDKRFQGIDEGIKARIRPLNTNQLEELAEALLDFSSLKDLEDWLSHLT